MRRTLTGEAILNLPTPNIHQLHAQLRTMYDGAKPVTGRELASAFNLSENAIVPVLRRCEQRGIYCTVSGRIECVGRLDPSGGASSSTAPRTSSGFDLLPSGQPPDRTCLDLQCSRYIDHGSGTVEQGVPACDQAQ